MLTVFVGSAHADNAYTTKDKPVELHGRLHMPPEIVPQSWLKDRNPAWEERRKSTEPNKLKKANYTVRTYAKLNEELVQFGDRIEDDLRRRFKLAIKSEHFKDQECRISFQVSKPGTMRTVDVIQESDDPSFNSFAKQIILSLKGQPELKLPGSFQNTDAIVTALFTLSKGCGWVTVHVALMPSGSRLAPR